MKNKRKKREIIWLILSVLVAIVCLLLPGAIVEFQANSKKQVIHQVYSSNYYGSSDTAAVMTLYERMKLISGEWDSNCQEVDPKEVQAISDAPKEAFDNVVEGQNGEVQLEGYSYMDYQSVLETAEEGMSTFYECGIYPENTVSQYGNWYRPTVSLYQYSDAVFDAYICYVWLVEFDYYDGSMQHVMLIDDTSGLILASGVKGDNYRLPASWKKSMTEAHTLPEEIINYYQRQQKIREPIVDISEADCYQPHYELWSERYGLSEDQRNGPRAGMTGKQYLFSASNVLYSYEEAEEEVKNIVLNEKFIYSLQWDDTQCWFCLVPFTVPIEADTGE